MKVFVIEPFGTGGLIHFAYQLCDALAKAGAEVVLVTSDDYELRDLPHEFELRAVLELWPSKDPVSMDLAPRSRLQKLGLRAKRSVRRAWRAVRLLASWWRISRMLLRERPDVAMFSILYHPILAFFLTRLARRGVTLAQICHEFEQRDVAGGWRRRLTDGMTRRAYQSFSAIFFLSKQVREDFLSRHAFLPERAHVIPHGSQGLFRNTVPEEVLRERYGVKPGKPVVLFFGVLRPSKGLPDLLEAFALLKKTLPAQLLIVGYPTKFLDQDELLRMIEVLGLTEDVVLDPRYLPNDEVPALLGLSSVVVFPYRNATQSGVLHLAYSFARPVIATSVGGLAEDVIDGQTGYLVPPLQPAELAAALERLLTDPARAAQMGRDAKAHSDAHHSWEIVADRVLGVYAGLVSGSGSAGRGDAPRPQEEGAGP